eukprot:3298876-Alexandrium_andersonii.AAC.1
MHVAQHGHPALISLAARFRVALSVLRKACLSACQEASDVACPCSQPGVRGHRNSRVGQGA